MSEATAKAYCVMVVESHQKVIEAYRLIAEAMGDGFDGDEEEWGSETTIEFYAALDVLCAGSETEWDSTAIRSAEHEDRYDMLAETWDKITEWWTDDPLGWLGA